MHRIFLALIIIGVSIIPIPGVGQQLTWQRGFFEDIYILDGEKIPRYEVEQILQNNALASYHWKQHKKLKTISIVTFLSGHIVFSAWSLRNLIKLNSNLTGPLLVEISTLTAGSILMLKANSERRIAFDNFNHSTPQLSLISYPDYIGFGLVFRLN